MARTRKVTTKQCAMTGMNFPVTEFYVNNNTVDGLHPYSKHSFYLFGNQGNHANELAIHWYFHFDCF